jgi:hypothetical protein
MINNYGHFSHERVYEMHGKLNIFSVTRKLTVPKAEVFSKTDHNY